MLDVPPFPEVPKFLRGRSFVVIEAVYLGDEADGADAPLRALGPDIDTFSTIPVVALSHRHMDPDHPAGNGDGMLLGDLPAEEIDAFVDAATGGLDPPCSRRRPVSSAARSPGPRGSTARSAPYITFAGSGMTPTPDLRAAVESQLAGAPLGAVSPRRLASLHMNFTERPIDSPMLYPQAETLP